MPVDGATRELADGSNTDPLVIGDGKFPLPSSGRLTHVSVGMLAAARGPLKVAVQLEFNNDPFTRQMIIPDTFIRSGGDFGFSKIVSWDGDIQLERISHIAVTTRNQSGATVNWILTWSWVKRQ